MFYPGNLSPFFLVSEMTLGKDLIGCQSLWGSQTIYILWFRLDRISLQEIRASKRFSLCKLNERLSQAVYVLKWKEREKKEGKKGKNEFKERRKQRKNIRRDKELVCKKAAFMDTRTFSGWRYRCYDYFANMNGWITQRMKLILSQGLPLFAWLVTNMNVGRGGKIGKWARLS